MKNDLVSAALVECEGKLKSPGELAKAQKRIINFHIPLKRSGFANDLEYFNARIYKHDSGCWLWRGGLDRSGYGTTKRGHPKAHRFAWTLFRGPIPEGKKVLHKCDVRNCVNLDHLFLGDQFDNMRDMVAKGRHKPSGVRGEAHGNTILTEANVREIRRLREIEKLHYRAIGNIFLVAPQTVHQICKFQRWGHVI